LPISESGKVTIVHVLPEEIRSRYRKQVERDAQLSLEKIARSISATHQKMERTDVSVSTVLRAGLPHVEIIRLARTEMVELIVLGKHGHHLVRDLLSAQPPRRLSARAAFRC
jgi:nucleotide-binding universal stress UspA family protein